MWGERGRGPIKPREEELGQRRELASFVSVARQEVKELFPAFMHDHLVLPAAKDRPRQLAGLRTGGRVPAVIGVLGQVNRLERRVRRREMFEAAGRVLRAVVRCTA